MINKWWAWSFKLTHYLDCVHFILFSRIFNALSSCVRSIFAGNHSDADLVDIAFYEHFAINTGTGMLEEIV